MAAFSWSASALPVADGGPEDVEIVAGEQRDGYRCLLVEYSAGEPGAGVQGEAVGTGERLRSYLLVPDSASPENRVPGIVLLHDHGARFDIGKEKLVRPLSGVPENIRLSSEQWVRDNFDGVYWADSLASEGYAVIVPDMLYWGGRSSAACRKWSELKFSDSGNLLETASRQTGHLRWIRRMYYRNIRDRLWFANVGRILTGCGITG